LLDPVPRLDPGRVVFGLSHTDGNQHVNFLVYPRFIEEAALGRFVDLGVGAKIAARYVEIRYRKPSFAGDSLRIVLQAFRKDGSFGVIAAAIDDDGGPPERPWAEFPPPRAIARVAFKP
jgi:acyl-CoA thioesterase FadM